MCKLLYWRNWPITCRLQCSFVFFRQSAVSESIVESKGVFTHTLFGPNQRTKRTKFHLVRTFWNGLNTNHRTLVRTKQADRDRAERSDSVRNKGVLVRIFWRCESRPDLMRTFCCFLPRELPSFAVVHWFIQLASKTVYKRFQCGSYSRSCSCVSK